MDLAAAASAEIGLLFVVLIANVVVGTKTQYKKSWKQKLKDLDWRQNFEVLVAFV